MEIVFRHGGLKRCGIKKEKNRLLQEFIKADKALEDERYDFKGLNWDSDRLNICPEMFKNGGYSIPGDLYLTVLKVYTSTLISNDAWDYFAEM